jgi:hypothetical protein
LSSQSKSMIYMAFATFIIVEIAAFIHPGNTRRVLLPHQCQMRGD